MTDKLQEKLLLLCACRPAPPADIEQLSGQSIDWEWLLLKAAQNGVTPLLHLALQSQASVSETVRAQLLDAYLKNFGHNLRMASGLVKILGLLAEKGVSALAYKGPALAVLAYGSLGMRCFGDLDIIVRRRELDAAKAALEANGYHCTLSREEEDYFLRDRYHLLFVGGDPQLNIEIHWAITPVYWPFPIDAARMWKAAASVDLLGTRIPTLDPEVTLLAICAHAAKERWSRLSMLCDLAWLLARFPELDWEWIGQEAARMGQTRVLLLGLLLGSALLEASVPDVLLERARADRVLVAMAGKIEECFFTRDLPSGLRFHIYAWRLWNRWPDRMGYLRREIGVLPAKLKTLMQPGEADGTLPAGLPWLWRPLRVIWQYRDLRRILRRISDNL